MKRARRKLEASVSFFIKGGAAMALAMALGTEPAEAQEHARYHYHNIGSLFAEPSAQTVALAINNDHVIVGSSAEGQPPFPPRAFIWVRCPRPDLGLNTAGMHNLHSIAGLSAARSVANGLNLDGQVVGWAGDIGLELAFVWNLPASSYFDIGTLGGPSSIATAVNDASPFEVVGFSDIRTTGVTRAFLWSNGTIRQLIPLEGDLEPRAQSEAFDINTRPTLPSLVSGFSYEELQECAANDDIGTTWEANAPEALEFPPSFGNPETARGLGVNDAGHIVGQAMNSFSTLDCRTFAMFWSGPTAIPIILPMPAGQEDDEAWAHAINEPTANNAVQIVGINTNDARALLWERADGSSLFEAVDLTSEIDVSGVVLREAFDITDHGWIVGRTTEIAFLLIPIDTCWGDINSDGVIGPADLAELLAQWGACTNCPCSADLTLDNIVGPADLANLLASWGVCTSVSGQSEAGAPQPGGNEAAWIEEVKLWLNGIGQTSLATELHQQYYGQ